MIYDEFDCRISGFQSRLKSDLRNSFAIDQSITNMASHLQAYFLIASTWTFLKYSDNSNTFVSFAVLLLSHFPTNQGFIINFFKQKFYDALILAGRTMQAIGHAGENASEYIKNLNVTEWSAMKVVGFIGNMLG